MATPDIRTATPQRTCIGCRQQRPQTELVRCVAGDQRAHVSRTAAGRGAWLCSVDCFRTAERRRAFDRAWKHKVSAEALRNLDRELHFALEGVVINMKELPGVDTVVDEPATEKG
jgi:predicted RNA-binding protein YlxR (DUF448 family)